MIIIVSFLRAARGWRGSTSRGDGFFGVGAAGRQIRGGKPHFDRLNSERLRSAVALVLRGRRDVRWPLSTRRDDYENAIT